ncbi:MAG: efflux RND transporter periplasmic adaptor subunit [bacterium]|nr:efflux RND transporter periplasmic adaptor subunit [bacterium]
MRSLLAYTLALLAILAGAWFGFLRGEQDAKADGPRRSRATPVILAPVVEAPFAETLDALGTAVANERVQLTANRSDLVRAVHFTDGQEVEAGALLVELEASEEAARLAEAKALLQGREAAHRRAVELSEQEITAGSTVDAALAELEAARARVATLEVLVADHQVRAPFAGRLGLRGISVGSLLQASTEIATLDDLSVIKVDFTIPETWLAAVREGMAIAARTDAWPEAVFPGRVAAIATRLDRITRSATVRAEVPNPDRRLRPGMLVKVRVDRGESPSLQVPEEALVQRADRHFVFVVAGTGDSTEGRAESGDEGAGEPGAYICRETEVRVGRRRVGRVEILSGLAVGQRVVVEGLARVRDGSAVNVVEVRGAGD